MLLAAGIGSRLDPLTRNVPKPMVPVMNRPAIEHILELLVRNGFDEVWVNLFTLGEQIEKHFGDGSKWGARITYNRESQLWGDAGSVKLAEKFLGDETFLVIGGDDITDMDLRKLVEFHKANRATATIGLYRVDDPSEYGIAVLDGDRIVAFQEKPSRHDALSDVANTGIYVFEPKVLDLIPPGVKHGLGKQVLPDILKAGEPFFGLCSPCYWCDIGGIPAYHKAHRDALSLRIALHGHCGSTDIPQVEGEVWIGECAEIGTHASLVGPCLLGTGCTVEDGSVVERSVLGNGSRIGHGAIIRDCVLWEGVRVGATAKLVTCVVTANREVESAREAQATAIA